MPTKPKSKAKTKTYTAILCNEKYGIYYGDVVGFDPASRVAQVLACRHVCQWFGRTGGITSLAEHGLCGPRSGESRIGAATSGRTPVTLTGIVNVFPVSEEARATFDAATAK